MAKKRTKKEKALARARRIAEMRVTEKPQTSPQFRVEGPKFYQPEIALDMGLVRGDLTRTLIVTILTLTLQLALARYLSQGGWQPVLDMIEKTLLERG